MRGDFLFYEEKIETTQEEREAKAARRLKLLFYFPRFNLTFFLGHIGHRILMLSYNLQSDGKIGRQNLMV